MLNKGTEKGREISFVLSSIETVLILMIPLDDTWNKREFLLFLMEELWMMVMEERVMVEEERENREEEGEMKLV
jgi:hypothetical protein